ncbi:MAG: hypothetical protein MJA83_10000 [Gammaproteobacteria bacterium]|nr:hypothetical protein [Gammaproteobacteria bacterium]
MVDPTFFEVEELLLTSDEANQPIFSRFGYLDRFGQVSSFWLQSRLINFIPRLDTKGMEITARTLVDVRDTITTLRSTDRVFQGKISQVVQQIADLMGVDSEIEETDDDGNLDFENDGGGPRTWRVRCMTLFDFMRRELVPIARSKSGQSDYNLWISGSKSRQRGESRPILHFHTKEFPQCVVREKEIKTFTYLLGKQDQVLDFQPSFNSSLLGNIGGGQVVMRDFNISPKGFATAVQNVDTNPNTVSVGTGRRTTSVPTNPEDPTSDQESQGCIITQERTPGESEARSRNVFEQLKSASYTAQLDLVGLPGNTDLEANDLINMEVLIPGNPSNRDAPYRAHWTSGLYRVVESVHVVSTGRYTITNQLHRDSSARGRGDQSGALLQADNVRDPNLSPAVQG